MLTFSYLLRVCNLFQFELFFNKFKKVYLKRN